MQLQFNSFVNINSTLQSFGSHSPESQGNFETFNMAVQHTKSCKVYIVLALIGFVALSGAAYLVFQTMKTSSDQIKLTPTTVKPILIEVTTLISQLTSSTPMEQIDTGEKKLGIETIGSTTTGSTGQSKSEGHQLENTITVPEAYGSKNETNQTMTMAVDKGDSNLSITTPHGSGVPLDKSLEATTAESSVEGGLASAVEANTEIFIGNTTEISPDENLTSSTQRAIPTTTTVPTVTMVLD